MRESRAAVIRQGILAAAASFVFFWAASGRAHPGYPAVVEQTLGLPVAPSCAICHQSPAGGGPLARFGTLLVSTYGLSASSAVENDGSLRAALQALEAGPDAYLVTVLKQGGDPSGPNAAVAPAQGDDGGPAGAQPAGPSEPMDPVPQYGCSCRTATRSGGPSPVGVGLVVAAWLLRVIRPRRGRNLQTAPCVSPARRP